MSSELTITELQETADRIRQRLNFVSEEMIEVGLELLKVKESLPHGRFGEWVLEELNMSQSTANNFMNVARNKERIGEPNQFTPSALYSLVASNVPSEALETAKEVAKTQGKPVGKKQAKEIVEQTRKTFVYEGEEVFSTLPNEKSLKHGDKVRYGGGFLSDRDMAMVRPITGSLGSFAVRKAWLREVEDEEPETYSLKPKLKTPEMAKPAPASPEFYEEEFETVHVSLQRVPKPEQSEDKIREFCNHVATSAEIHPQIDEFLEFPIALDRRKFLSEVYFGRISEGFILLSVDVMESPDIPDLLKAATAIAFIREEGMLVLLYFGRQAVTFCAPYEGLEKTAFLTLIDRSPAFPPSEGGEDESP